jgi:altronate hydrolase
MMNTLRLHANDNVVLATTALEIGTDLGDGVKTQQKIPARHKVATTDIPDGGAVRKYGQIIGFAAGSIQAGMHVHAHNCLMREFERDYAFCTDVQAVDPVPDSEQRYFFGFPRADGRVGTRNYLGIVTSVNCSATSARQIAEAVNQSGVLNDFPNVDGVVSLQHAWGCCMSSSGDGFDALQRVLAGYAAHPNFGGVLLLGLGCETMQIPRMMKAQGLESSGTLRTATIQALGGTRKSVEWGVAQLTGMLPDINAQCRVRTPVSELMVALQCGGSDGYSGITANPAMGSAVDLLVRHGGTAILAETPEIYGAEHLLTRRAVSEAVGRKLLERLAWWEVYTRNNGAEMNNNPTPGNKAGGLSTILEKSLGAVAKGGTTPLVDVYRYAERVTARGFVFMDSPGFDPVAITGEVAGGANLICFSTGRGSAFGFKPTPSVKLSTNTTTYEQMLEDMDIDCGTVLADRSIEEKGREIFDFWIQVASGTKTKSEIMDYGNNEFTPWQIGAVM